MNSETLARAVLEMAKAHNICLVAAESCTAGAVASALATAPGAGEHLAGSFVVYTKEMKTAALGVPQDLLLKKTAVCAEVAAAMAMGALERSPADVAVAITGVAGPEPDEDGNPVGLVFCSTAKRGGQPLTKRFFFEGRPRESVIEAAACEALRLLLEVCDFSQSGPGVS
jgi:nicotinamide-nucleotide amidase